jgi:hypothetical protein
MIYTDLKSRAWLVWFWYAKIPSCGFQRSATLLHPRSSRRLGFQCLLISKAFGSHFLVIPTISGNLLLARSNPRNDNQLGFWNSFGTAQVDLELTNWGVNPSLRQFYGYTVSLPAPDNAHLPIVFASIF